MVRFQRVPGLPWLSAIACFATFCACSAVVAAAADTQPKQQVQPPPPPPLPPFMLEGRVDSPSGVRRLAFGRMGRIAMLDAKVGDKLRRDQTVASLNCNDVKADLAGAEADLELQRLNFTRRGLAPEPSEIEVANERLSLAKADLATAETTRDRLEALFRTNGLASKQELEAASRRLMAAKLDVSAAQLALDRVKRRVLPEDENENNAREKASAANIARIRHQLSLCDLISPVDGTVLAVNFKVGEIAGGLDTILSVVSSEPRQISMFIPEADLSRVRVGQKVKIKVPALQENNLDGVVTRMMPSMATAGSQATARCSDACGMIAWVDTSDKISSAPLYSVAYVYP